MKKLIALLLSMTLVFSLAACGRRSQTTATETSQAAVENTSAPESAQEPVDQPDEESTAAPTEEAAIETKAQAGKTLVVFYSASGNTKEVAGYIAAATGADTFELVPVAPYTSEDLDWTNPNSRVSREHDNPDARSVELVQATVSDWAAYDTVFIGYPIWWGIAAWPVNGFIAANDFTGKTVIPFCTSSTSELGESGAFLADAGGTGNWMEGHRFQSGASQDTVNAWVASLGL